MSGWALTARARRGSVGRATIADVEEDHVVCVACEVDSAFDLGSVVACEGSDQFLLGWGAGLGASREFIGGWDWFLEARVLGNVTSAGGGRLLTVAIGAAF